MTRPRRAGALALAATAALPVTVLAQLARADSADLRRHDFAVLAVSPHPWSTTVALTVVLPTGSADDPSELPGSAWLLGKVVRDALQERLSRTGAAAGVLVDRSHTTYQVLAVPGAWREAYEALVEVVFSGSPDSRSLDRHRTELHAVFGFERGAPVREFEAQLVELVGGVGSSWSRDPRGAPEALERITASDLTSLRRRLYRAEDAVMTLVGALDAEPGLLLYPGRRSTVRSALGGRGGRGGSARSSGRERLERDVTNTWIGVALTVPRDVPRTVLEFIEQRLRDELNPTPADPGLFGTQVRIEETPDGPTLVVESAVLPEEQSRWEERILRTIDTLAERHREPTFFHAQRRRFRNLRLTEEGAPEVEGRRMAMDLLREGRVRDLPAEIGELDPDHVARALDDLSPPRILVFGPALGGEDR